MTRRSRQRHGTVKPFHDTANPDEARFGRHSVWSWSAVFAVAAATRLVVAAQLWDLPLVRTPKLDSGEYLSWATRLAAGDYSWPVVSAHGPGYPLFLAVLLRLLGGSLHAVLAAQALIGALTAVIVALVAARWFGRLAGMLAGLVYALYGPVVYVETSLLAEGFLLFLFAASLLILSQETVTIAHAVTAGATLGVATLVRPTTVFILGAFVMWLLISAARKQHHSWRLASVMVVASAAMITPALIKNWTVSRSVGVQGFGGMNWYIGNSPLYSGRPEFRLGAGWDALNSEPLRAGVTDPVEQDRYFVRKVFEEIRRQPLAYLTLLGRKIVWLVQADEVRDTHSFYFFAAQSAGLRYLPRMSVMLPLALMGCVALRRGRGWPALLAYYIAGGALTFVALVVGLRYRMPLVPALAILAGAALASLMSAVSHRRSELAMYAAAVGVGVAVSHVYADASSHNLAEEWAFTGASLVTERNLGDAENAYRTALTLDSKSGWAWDGLGLVFLNSKRLDEAEEAFQRAARLDPLSADAVFHLGLVADLQGRADTAVSGYRRALELSPQNLDITRRLGAALLSAGKAPEAISVLKIVTEQRPADSAAHRDLATALGVSGRTLEAMAEMRHVVQLTPSDGEAWVDLSLLSVDVGDIESAAVALQRATDAGASRERLEFASTVLSHAKRKH